MDLSIIIVNYNTPELTINCIGSVIDQTPDLSLEIIVVDNASDRNDAELITQKFPSITLIQNKSNIGFGRANNQGIDISNGNYILLLNSDTIILDHAISKCLYFMDSEFALENNIGLLGCLLKDEFGRIQQSTFESSNIIGYLISGNPILSKISGRHKGKIDPKNCQTMGQFVTGVSGAFMFFRRSVFDKVKPFDPDFFMYSEESELCRNRVSKHFKVFYYTDALVLHLVGKSSFQTQAHYQKLVSYALTWYKKGIAMYCLYILISALNFFTLLLIWPMSKNRESISRNILGFIRIFKYLVTDIPRYPRRWGARKNPLIIN